jgi:hypothetical protein
MRFWFPYHRKVLVMPVPDGPTDVVDIALVDGRRRQVHTRIAERIRGVDADGDLLIPLGDPDRPIYHDDGAEYLIPSPLLPCQRQRR